jgi:uncharacterized protein (TIGR02145 family)
MRIADGNKTDVCEITVNLIGKVSFKSSKTWTVGSQTWSDAVMATGCKKNSYKGHIIENDMYIYFADCRQAPGYGDHFSWDAVNIYKSQLCPDGWRVPTAADFLALNLALGGKDVGLDGDYADPAIAEKFLSDWGGEPGGVTSGFGALLGSGTLAFYWSQTEYDRENSFGSHFSVDGWGWIFPAWWASKFQGKVVRCIK